MIRIEGHEPKGVGSFPVSLQVGKVAGGGSEVIRERAEEGSQRTLSFPLDAEKLGELGEVLRSLFKLFNLELRFRIHEPTGEIIARIVDRETGEVIREIPPEKFLDMIAKLQELAGVFVDEVV